VVQTATSRDASVDYGDLVLWDAAPIGFDRETTPDRPIPRFPILALLKRGRERRYPFVGLQKRAGEIESIQRALPEHVLLFVHHERVETVCAHCALDESRDETAAAGHHDEPSELVYGKLVLAESIDLHAFRHQLDAITAAHADVKLVVPGLLEGVGDSPAAGKAHQAWRGIERAVARKHGVQ
jgi:hypothetical protein